MVPRRIMVVAGEPSGDLLGAELVTALKEHPTIKSLRFPAKFFGAGGPKMAEAGVELRVNLTEHAVVGAEPLKHPFKFIGFLRELVRHAQQLQPDVIILVDNSGFNLRFAKKLKEFERAARHTFNNWYPKIVYFVSPQVWASREWRIHQMNRDIDLLLTMFPFEKEWYAKRVLDMRVEFVGHPLTDRYQHLRQQMESRGSELSDPPKIVMLPGSREAELKRHIPVMMATIKQIQQHHSVRCDIILPNRALVEKARDLLTDRDIPIRSEGLAEHLLDADLAIAKSGTVTMECAYFRVPAVVIYQASWLTYLLAKAMTNVNHLAMPNLLADEPIYPELLQRQATPDAIAKASLELLDRPEKREWVKAKLDQVVESLGPPGATKRAAEFIVDFLKAQPLPVFKGSLWAAPEPEPEPERQPVARP